MYSDASGKSTTTFQRVSAFQIALLKRLEFEWSDGGYDGSPTVDSKRPYGNSDVLGDLREIYAESLGLQYVDADELGHFFVREDGSRFEADQLDYELWAQHKSMHTILQILCANPTEPLQEGVYAKEEQYSHDWKYVGKN